MATFRKVHTTFWKDAYVQGLTPEKKYFFLYLLTNDQTKQCGIYEITKKTISNDTGYTLEVVELFLKEFERDGKIRYNTQTFEVAIKNWEKYNGSRSPSVQTLVKEELAFVKDSVLIQWVYSADTIPAIEEEKEEEEEKEKNKKKNPPKKAGVELVFPFSEKFKEYWDLWKQYKKEQHRFTYKSVLSEQAALNNVVKMSGGNEEIACDIIHQSIAQGWQGLFAIKSANNNGTATGKQANGKYDINSLKQKLSQRFDQRRQAGG